MTHLSDYVNPYIGTISYLLQATKPLVHLPHGMAQIRPVLDEAIRDHYLAPVIYGFPASRCRVMPDTDSADCSMNLFSQILDVSIWPFSIG